MRNKKINIFLILFSIGLIALMLKGTFFQPGPGDLKAGFRQIASYRNENNTGPIQYVFSVSVKDTIWHDMETFGNYKPHHKGGSTKVYYFLERDTIPSQLRPGKENFDHYFNKYCIGMYEKTAVGNVILTRYPFR